MAKTIPGTIWIYSRKLSYNIFESNRAFFKYRIGVNKISKKTIRRGIIKNGRPKNLPQNIEEDTFLYVSKCWELGLPPTISDIQNYLETKNEIYILADTLRKYYKRNDLYEVKKLAPIENERIQVKSEDINLYFNHLSAAIDGIPASFVINLDELVFDKFADASKWYMIVPKGKIINNYGIDRKMIYKVAKSGCPSVQPLFSTFWMV